MAKKTVSGVVVQITQNKMQDVIVIETSEAKPPANGKPGVPAERFAISTTTKSILKGYNTGDTLKITIE